MRNTPLDIERVTSEDVIIDLDRLDVPRLLRDCMRLYRESGCALCFPGIDVIEDDQPRWVGLIFVF